MKKVKFFFLLMSLSMSVLSYAQVTTSSMSGRVTDENGSPIEFATIVAVHTPTNSQYSAYADHNGNYRLPNLRPGGPYKVVVKLLGYQSVEFDNINLALGSNLDLDAQMEIESFDLEELVISADTKNSNMSIRNAGAITNVSEKNIALMPTINRSINDLTRLSPYANGQAIGGGNFRQSFITVDGAQFNNMFGIGSNLPGPTTGTPISIDALEQISISITPYDVRQSGFLGASVNAVTKSGDNKFRGSAYTYYTDETFRGNKVGDQTFEKNEAKNKLYGANISGPIIKDKLFFFASYEYEPNQAPGPNRKASRNTADWDGGKNEYNFPSEAFMNTVSDYLIGTYGYDPGAYQGYSFDLSSSRMLVRLDWNINKDHKLNVRYTSMKSREFAPPSTSFSPFSSGEIYSGVTYSRQSYTAMYFKNSNYFTEDNYTTYAAELSSSLFKSKLGNMLRFTYAYQDIPRSWDGKQFPFVDILGSDDPAKNGGLDVPAAQVGYPLVSFGVDPFTVGNLRDVKTWTITDDATWTWGKNNMTAGINYEHTNVRNGFQRFAQGYYVFDSWADFVNGNNPRNYAITFSNLPGYPQAFPEFKFNQFTVYLQDDIRFSNRFNLTLGFRIDLPIYPHSMETHPLILDLDYGGEHFDTGKLPTQRPLYSPRAGFNWDILGDRKMVLRGGTGIFTGRVPFVWMVAQSGDAGMVQNTILYGESNIGRVFDPVPGPFNPDRYLPSVQPPAGTVIPSMFTVIDPDLRMPQTWKSSLALDVKLPGDIKGSVEGVYSKDINGIYIRNANLKPDMVENMDVSISSSLKYPDNRPIYPSATADRLYNSSVTPYVLYSIRNTGAYYASVTAKLEKSFINGFDGMIAYTHSWAKNITDGSGDQVSSTWNINNTVTGTNNPELSYANYVVPNKLIGSLSYRKEYAKNFATGISLLYDGSEGGRFSYTYASAIVGDGGPANLIYVPQSCFDPSEIRFVDQVVQGQTWTAEAQAAAFESFIRQDKYLNSRRGQYAERNGVLRPFTSTFDLKILQDFYVNIKGNRNCLQVGLDIMNLGNLINSNWGNNWSYTQGSILVLTNSPLTPGASDKVPTFRLNPYANKMISESFYKTLGYSSTYRMQLSVRYIFN